MKSAIGLFVLLSAACFADKITLTDGRVYEGVVLEDSEKGVKIKTSKATLTFPKDQVATIEKGAAPVSDASQRFEALSPDNPKGYLELAKWLSKEGKTSADESKMKRICNAAAYLDRSLALEANLILAKYMVERPNRPEAARAFTRAHNADPQHAEALQRFQEYRVELESLGKRDLGQLADALDLVLKNQYEAAIPALRRCQRLLFADQAPTHMKMSVEALANDLQRRVPCKPCGGKAIADCVPCGGKGKIVCNVCDGKGMKKGFQSGSNETIKYSAGVCRSCCGQGSVLCVPCKAERSVTISFQNPERPAESRSVDVKTTASKWREEMKAQLDLGRYIATQDNWWCTGVSAGSNTLGGRRACPTCKGVKFEPPSTPPDNASIAAYVKEIQARIDGTTRFDFTPPADEIYDLEQVDEGKFRFRNGKWVE